MEDHFNRMLNSSITSTSSNVSSAEEREKKNPSKKKAHFEDENARAKIPKLETPIVETITTKAQLKTRLSAVEKKIKTNQTKRLSLKPGVFMESELALHRSLMTFREQVAVVPELFSAAIDFGPLLQLLTHENIDIVLEVVKLLMEVTDPQNAIENEEGTKAMLKQLISKQNLLPLLIENLSRFSSAGEKEVKEGEEDEEAAQGIHNVLTIVENLIEIEPTLQRDVVKQTNILSFLTSQIPMGNKRKKREAVLFDANRLYCSEILAILLQQQEENQKAMDAKEMDIILTCISSYRKKPPVSLEEEEFLCNLFDILSSLLLVEINQNYFRKLEGFELMLRCVRERNYARDGGLRLLADGIYGNSSNCVRLIEIGGLKTVFATLMGKNRMKVSSFSLKLKRQSVDKDEEIMLTLLLQLILYSNGSSRSRLHVKFTEKNYEKIDRLVEIYQKYKNEGTEENEVLEKCCFCLAHLMRFSIGLQNYIMDKMHQEKEELQDVVEILVDYLQLMKESSPTTDALRKELDYLQQLVDYFTVLEEEPQDAEHKEEQESL